MSGHRRTRNRIQANVAHDEDERNKCRAQGMLAGAISGGVAFAIFALSEFTKMTPEGAPFWVTLPVAAIFAGSVWVASGLGGFVGRDVGSYIIYPTRMGNHRRATIALLLLVATGGVFAGLGLLYIEVVTYFLTLG